MTIWNLMNNPNFLLDRSLFVVAIVIIIFGICIIGKIKKEKKIKKYLKEIEKKAKRT